MTKIVYYRAPSFDDMYLWCPPDLPFVFRQHDVTTSLSEVEVMQSFRSSKNVNYVPGDKVFLPTGHLFFSTTYALPVKQTCRLELIEME